MEITGKITKILPKITVGSNNTEKQSIVVEEHTGEYPNSLCIDFMHDKTKKLESFTKGDIVTVKYNTKAREHKDRIYNGISGRSIELVGAGSVEDDGSENGLPF